MAAVGVTEIRRDDVNSELLPYLPYRATDAADFDNRRDEFKRTDGRKVA